MVVNQQNHGHEFNTKIVQKKSYFVILKYQMPIKIEVLSGPQHSILLCGSQVLVLKNNVCILHCYWFIYQNIPLHCIALPKHKCPV